MSFICGFFNSVNGDRKYNAEQMNNPYKRIISNGVFAQSDGTPSTDLQVQAASDMNVIVHTGEGIFAGKWAKLDANMTFAVPNAHVTLKRIDSVIVRIDETADVRAGSIVYREGTPASNPTPPAIERSTYVTEYRLANITVEANAVSIPQSKIEDTRIGSDCGFSTHLLKQYDFTATYAQFTAEFEEWFSTVRETLATATLIRSYTSRYVTSTQDETHIPIQITQYNSALDILQVFVNGLRLIPDVEYSVDSNTQITLTAGVDSGTPVSFVVYKSVDGSDAETVVTQVATLQRLQSTSDTGSTKINVSSGQDALQMFINAGKGLHTMYIQSGATGMPATGAFRAFGHVTGETAGWIIALQANGSVYANYYNESAWRGWKVLHEVAPEALYYSASGVFPTSGTTITPSKPLSECQHGWQFVFCGYDDVAKVARDVYVQSFNVPKKSHKNANWNGESISVPLIYQYVTENDTALMCQKTLTIYNDRVIAGTTASTGKQRNLVLKAIYEY